MHFSKKQFAAMCGIESNKLSVYVGRGKVVMSGDQIDTSIKQNAEFLEKWQKKSGVLQKTEGVPEVKVTKSQLELTEPREESENISDSFNENSSDDALSRAKKYAELKAKDIEIRLKLIEEEKKRGELIPTHHVKSIISTQARSNITAYRDELEKMLIKISAKTKMSLEDLAFFKTEVVNAVNTAINVSVEQSKKELKKIQLEAEL